VKLTIGYFYPTIMSHYGDRGNLFTLQRRCAWRRIETEVVNLELGVPFDADRIDLMLMGGGADLHQRQIAEDLVDVKGPGVRAAVEDGAAALMICGGYQLLGHYYRPFRGEDLPGLGIFDAYTIHRAAEIGAPIRNLTEAAAVRSVNNMVIQWEGRTLVGFENHGGQTYLNPGARPLGRVVLGKGNNGKDGFEGCLYKSAIGTYLHGSVLPKNPRLADWLIGAGLGRRHGEVDLEPLDDTLEERAHEAAIVRARTADPGRIERSHRS
jgi:lipid II isoglutaminyl synthase (glutamine-hydrolysing)